MSGQRSPNPLVGSDDSIQEWRRCFNNVNLLVPHAEDLGPTAYPTSKLQRGLASVIRNDHVSEMEMKVLYTLIYFSGVVVARQLFQVLNLVHVRIPMLVLLEPQREESVIKNQ